jgi:hypothetical protein
MTTDRLRYRSLPLDGLTNQSERETNSVPIVAAFYSINEGQKPVGKQVHHNNSNCAPGRDIPSWERKPGTGGYRLCDICQEETNKGR